MELRLLPKRSIFWFVWLGLLIWFLPRYYSVFPFPQLIAQYETELWIGTTDAERAKAVWPPEPEDVGTQWSVTARVPTVVADFTNVPMSVSLRNKGSEAASAEVSVSLECQDKKQQENNVTCSQRVYPRIWVQGREQNSAFIEDIPPDGEATVWFDLRVVIEDALGSEAPSFIANVKVNDKRVPQTHRAFLINHNRQKLFRLWAIENLLSPPGSNIVVPIFFLFIVVLAEIIADMVVMLWNTGQHREPRGHGNSDAFLESLGVQSAEKESAVRTTRWAFAVLLLLMIIASVVALWIPKPWIEVGPFSSDQALDVGLRRTVFWFVIGAIVLGLLFGSLASTLKQDPPKE